MRAHKRPGRAPCSVDECARPLYCKGFCVMHYTRSRHGVDPFACPQPLRSAPGEGSVIADGYRVLNIPSHPLARAQGKVAEHRVVLFAKIGAADHSCHWCGKLLAWTGVRQSVKIMADHVDHDRLNNDPTNLVPACLDCNTKRRAKPREPRPLRPHLVLTEGQRERARQRAREWYAANREQVLARMRAQRIARAAA